MSKITFHQAAHLPRAHEDLSSRTQLEAIIPVPVEGHPMAQHFRRCGLGHFDTPLTASQLKPLAEAADRIAVTLTNNEMRVVVDGKYRAGGFKLDHNYEDRGAIEVQAAECAARTVVKLAEGQQPSDMKLGLV